jgi:crotonobetainyl-CoA:carnitine CoA-transferase CaiB-like acyl-CoA transferase
VLSIPELVDAPHWRARRVFASAEHRERGAFRQLGPVLAGMRRDGPPHRVRADDETDARSLLADAGMADDEIGQLIEEGTVE